MRKCNQCDFSVQSRQSGTPGIAEELAAMSDHLDLHNPTPQQWHEAYKLMSAKRRKSDE